MDRRERGRQILAEGMQRTEKPGRAGHPDCLHRWAERFPRRDPHRIPADAHTAVHHPPDPQYHQICLLQRPEGTGEKRGAISSDVSFLQIERIENYEDIMSQFADFENFYEKPAKIWT